MQGKVIWINSNNFEEIKVQFNMNRIATIELLGANVRIEDVLEGNFENLGSEKLFNISQNEYIDVIFQDFD